MSTYNTYSFKLEQLSRSANDNKERFLSVMLEQKEISQEQYDKMSKYALVAHERGFFGRIIDKMLGTEDEGKTWCTVVKILD